MDGRRLLIVSNRLPVSLCVVEQKHTLEPSAGGLATGLSGVHNGGPHLWIGTLGDLTPLPESAACHVEEQLAAKRYHHVNIVSAEYDAYYEQFANGVLWPLFHMMPDRIPLHSGGWEAYKRVNQRFADAVSALYRDGDVVWVHDYQLMLVPSMLRQQLPHARIGFFLHIPFPPFELYRTLPWARELVQGLAGSDLVGFHIEAYRQDFMQCACKLLSCKTLMDEPRVSDDKDAKARGANSPRSNESSTAPAMSSSVDSATPATITLQVPTVGGSATASGTGRHADIRGVAPPSSASSPSSSSSEIAMTPSRRVTTSWKPLRVDVENSFRSVMLSVFPMGIDTQKFQDLANSPDVQREAQLIRRSSSARFIVLGIDRLDYTKGIPRRLLAFERLLTAHPELRDQVVLIQVAVPSRAALHEYRDFTAHLNEMVGRINGAYATATHSPIIYMYRSISVRELIALYLAADVMAVTPLRDGMNLVAKEFVASRVDDGGALLLSEFAGAAEELRGHAFMINPFDIDGTAEMMVQALRATDADKRDRMHQLRQTVLRQSVHDWALAFLQQLSIATANVMSAKSSLPSPSPLATQIDAAELSNLHYVDSEQRAHAALQQQVGLCVEAVNVGAAGADANIAEGLFRPVLLLDYDGTLVPLAQSPALASPDLPLLELLAKLAGVCEVHIVSGRLRDELKHWLGQLPIHLWAEHGAFVHLPASSSSSSASSCSLRNQTCQQKLLPVTESSATWVSPPCSASSGPPHPSHDDRVSTQEPFWFATVGDLEIDSWKPVVLLQLHALSSQYTGSFVEVKAHSLAFHFRQVVDLTQAETDSICLSLNAVIADHVSLHVLSGAKVFEVRPKHVNKATVARWLVQDCGIASHRLIAFGDDVTDEDLFAALPADSLTIHVQKGNPDWSDEVSPVQQTCARASVHHYRAVRRLLHALAHHLTELERSDRGHVSGQPSSANDE